MSHDLIRNNHYVPIWYQKNFLSANKGAFYYLNLYPELIKLPSGEIRHKKQILWPFSPKQCFYQTDLYTTSFLGILNDEIERYLFGDVDSYGAISIKALAENDFKLLHKYLVKFFEYLDIQKIRTVKGLSWLSLKYPAISHNVLLIEMQRIRRLHCTIWAETVKEIVSAKNSEVKFIVSDHPVTIYNPACPPDSIDCKYPNDPRIEMKGSQTIFPLNSNQCLILTNLDYAKNPELRDLKALRPNPNPYRNTLVRLDNIINTRELSEEEVTHINRIIKFRAARFLAAEKKEWLFPEKVITSNWAKSAKILMPAKDQLFHYGGEIYVGHKDGTTSYFDQYGRTTPDSKFLQKKIGTEKIGRNDPCSCGSGKKYKNCCIGKPLDERPSNDVLSIRERNLLFFDAITKILGYKKNRSLDWDEIRRNLTNSKIAEIHEVIAALWPPDTDLFALLPRPDKNVFRALYTGLVDPRETYANIACFSSFADEILVQSPFINANNLKNEFSPIKNPAQYRSETIKNLLFFLVIMPWIETGLVSLFPDPWYFNHSLMTSVMEAAEERGDAITFDEKDYQKIKNVFLEDHKRNTLALPDNVLKKIIRKRSPDISDEDLNSVLEYNKKTRSQDPLADLNPEYGEKTGQMLIGRISPNMEMTMFLAQATGSMIVTDNSFRWSELCASIPLYYQTSQSPWSTLESFLSDFPVKIPFIINHPDLASQLKRPEFAQTKNHLRYVWNAIVENRPLNSPQIESFKNDFIIAQEKMLQAFQKFKTKQESSPQFLDLQKPILVDAKLNCKIAPKGHTNNLVYRLLMSFAGHEKYLKSLPLSLYIEFMNRE